MEIRLVTIKLHLEGCQSLKEKRQRLSGLKKRIGKESYFAILESEFQDVVQTARWSVTIMGDHPAQVSQRIATLENTLLEGLDARIISFSQETIY